MLNLLLLLAALSAEPADQDLAIVLLNERREPVVHVISRSHAREVHDDLAQLRFRYPQLAQLESALALALGARPVQTVVPITDEHRLRHHEVQQNNGGFEPRLRLRR